MTFLREKGWLLDVGPSRRCRREFLTAVVLGWLCAAPVSAQKVTFDVYPPDAKVYYQGGYPDPIPLGLAGEPIDLGRLFNDKDGYVARNKYALKVIISAQGRETFEATYAGGSKEIEDGTVIAVYLHPKNPLLYVIDFPQVRPGAFALTLSLFLLALGLVTRLALQKRAQGQAIKASVDRQQLLKDLGADYERPFDKWVIVGKVGSGGMGEVLRAFPKDDIRSESMVAIKMRGTFDPQAATQELLEREGEERERFLIETKVLAGLDHPGIVKLYDWGVHEGRDYYVMELVQGESLQSYLDRHPCPGFDEVRTLFTQLLDVVIFAHQKGILHRDLKPLNILRGEQGKLTVIDFGLARDQKKTVAYTQQGMPMAGSFEYMDPRVSLQMFQKIAPTPSDEGADQFALGGILFLMLTGQPSIVLPQEVDNTSLMTILMSLGEPRRSALSARPDLPVELDAVVTKMLAVDVVERFANLNEAKDAFLRAIRPYV